MVFHSQTTTDDFLDWLRDSGIRGGMPPAFIDCVDDLYRWQDQEEEIEKLGDQVADAEEALADVKDDLQVLYDAVMNAPDEAVNLDACPALSRAVKRTKEALFGG